MLVWMDLEMTGLDVESNVIVEVATLITDDDLAIVAEGPDLVVSTAPEQLAAMDEFVRGMHTKSGLLAAIEEYLHYRSVDVSTIKELARRWYPEAMAGAPHKAGGHRAMDDIRESVAELAYYRTAVFRDATNA